VNTPREEVRVKGPGLDRFARFKKEEPALWKPARSANELVPPSGQLESPIAHHLHNPSFYTLTPHDGETAENYRDSLPEEIETLCESCQSKLKDLNLSDGEGNVIDKVPRWTVQDPPRYVLHRLKCPVCKGNWKFVPVNPHIPFIPAKTLRDLEQSFRHVADSVAVDALSRRYPVAEWIDKFLMS
jgi:hypothetical protein